MCSTFQDSFGRNLISKENQNFKSKICRSFYFSFYYIELLRPSNFHEFRPQECQIWDVRGKSVVIICSIYFIKKQQHTVRYRDIPSSNKLYLHFGKSAKKNAFFTSLPSVFYWKSLQINAPNLNLESFKELLYYLE